MKGKYSGQKRGKPLPVLPCDYFDRPSEPSSFLTIYGYGKDRFGNCLYSTSLGALDEAGVRWHAKKAEGVMIEGPLGELHNVTGVDMDIVLDQGRKIAARREEEAKLREKYGLYRRV